MADLGEASAGNIVVNLTLNTGSLESSIKEGNEQIRSMGSVIRAEFAKSGGYVGALGEAIGSIGKNINKMFGDEAPAAMQKFGSETQRALGLTDGQVKGIGQSLQALEGAFKVAGTAVSYLLGPMGAVLGAALATVGAIGAMDKAISASRGPTGGATGKRGGFLGNIASLWLGEAPGMNGSASPAAGSGFFSDDNTKLTRWLMDKAGIQRGTHGLPSAGGAASSSAGGLGVGDAVKEYVVDPIRDSLKHGLEMIKPILDELKVFGTPGTSSVDRKKSASESHSALLKAFEDNDAARKALDDYEAEQNKRRLDAAKANADDFEEFFDLNKKNRDKEIKLSDERIRAEEERLALADRAVQDAERMIAESERRRWDALSGGQFGSAAGLGGAGGTALDLAGGAAVGQSQYLGGVLQGAAQGGSNGPWGALVGAIMGLLTRTQTFSEVIKALDNILGGVISVLDALLGKIGEGIGMIGSIVGNVLKFVSSIVTVASAFDLGGQVLNGALRGVEQLMDAIGTVADAIQAWGSGISDYIGGAIDYMLGNDQRSQENSSLARGALDLFNQLNETQNALELMRNPIYQNMYAFEYMKSAQLGYTQQIRESTLGLKFLTENADLVKASIKSSILYQQEYDRLQKEVEAEMGLNKVADASNAAANSMTKFSESITNVPTGFKLALARYNSTDGDASLPVGNSLAPKVSVVVRLDGKEIAAEIEKKSDADFYNQTGSTSRTSGDQINSRDR